MKKVITLIISAILVGQVVAQKDLKPGLNLSIYDLGGYNTSLLPELEEGQVPSMTDVIPNIALANYLKNLNKYYPKTTSLFVIEGYIKIPKNTSYNFKLRSKESSEFYIDGKKLIDIRTKGHGVPEKINGIDLTEGYHKIKVVYVKNRMASYKEITLWWSGLEGKMEYIPAEYFFREDASIEVDDSETKKVKGEEAFEVVWGDGFKLNAVHPSYDLIKVRPEEFHPRVAAIDFYPNGTMVLTTWDSAGGVYLIKNLDKNDPSKTEVKRIAAGVAEPLGVKVVDGRLFVLQKQELTELIDHDGDEIIDEYRTICNKWGVTANFHEFAFGLAYKDGFFYAALAIAIQPGGKSTIPQNEERGSIIKIGMDGSYERIAKGVRTPNGLDIGVDGELFVADNQGSWLPSCKIMHVKKGAFYGNYSVFINEAGRWEETPPVVWLPQGEIGNSPGNPILCQDGIYKGQMIHPEVTHGGIKRVFVEKIKGEYQGVVFRFMQGLEAGINRIKYSPDGALYAGGIGVSGNWGEYGKLEYGLEKLKYNGKTTFEMLAIRAKSNGMEIEFTDAVDSLKATNADNYTLTTYHYKPTIRYGGPKVGVQRVRIKSVSVYKGAKKVFLEFDMPAEKNIVQYRLNKDLVSKKGETLWTTEAWYTLNNIPENENGVVTAPQPKASKKAVTKKKAVVKKTPVKKVAKPKIAGPVSKEQEKIMVIQGKKLIPISGCTACHAMKVKVLGPSFNDIAKKYPNDHKTYLQLTKKVMEGGSGVWGEHAMSPQSHLKKENIEKMVKYILSLDE